MSERRRMSFNSIKLTLSDNNIVVTSHAGSTLTIVKCNEVNLTSDDVNIYSSESWVHPVWSSNDSTVTISYDANISLVNSRNAIITILYGTASVDYNLTQDKGTLYLSPNERSVSYTSGSCTYTIMVSGVKYTSTVTIPNKSNWLTTSVNNGVVTVSYSEHIYTSPRVGEFTIKAGSYNTTGKIYQSNISLDCANKPFSTNACATNIQSNLSSNQSRYDITVSTNVDWLSVSNYHGTLHMNTSGNHTDATRNATIYLSYPGLSGSVTTTFTQSYVNTITLMSDGTIDGHKYVTIGGIKWAISNVGASSDGGQGKYYQWGSGSTQWSTKDNYYTGWTSSSTKLPSSADTATQVMGGSWRMPTRQECNDLINNTNQKLVKFKRGSSYIIGRLFTSKTDSSKYIFFPYDGQVWNGTPDLFDQETHIWCSTAGLSYNRYYGELLSILGNSSVKTGISSRNTSGICVRGVHA